MGWSNVTCPACNAPVTVYRPPTPRIDACGFESYSFECERCGAMLAGIIDPQDDALLVSLLEARHIPTRRFLNARAASSDVPHPRAAFFGLAALVLFGWRRNRRAQTKVPLRSAGTRPGHD
jgi:MYXO-CTERM domain-containing protein